MSYIYRVTEWLEPYDGATHPDVGTYEDESVADTPEVERYDPQLDADLTDRWTA